MAFAEIRADAMNDARIAMLETLHRLKSPMDTQVLYGPTRDPDYVVRLTAAELLCQSGLAAMNHQMPVGQVPSDQNQAYWQRVAQLTSSSKNPIALLHTPKGEFGLNSSRQTRP